MAVSRCRSKVAGETRFGSWALVQSFRQYRSPSPCSVNSICTLNLDTWEGSYIDFQKYFFESASISLVDMIVALVALVDMIVPHSLLRSEMFDKLACDHGALLSISLETEEGPKALSPHKSPFHWRVCRGTFLRRLAPHRRMEMQHTGSAAG
jgi:hypothetical protein